MSRAWVLILAIALGAGGCLWFVLSGQYASGNVYEEYSSQRTDRMGTAALYEALSRIDPQVSRNEIPLQSLNLKNSEILILGLSPRAFDADYINELETAARNGNRVVVALDAAAWIFDYKKINDPLWDKWHVRILDSRDLNVNDTEGLRARDFLKFAPGDGAGWMSSGLTVSRKFGNGALVLVGGSWAFTNAALRESRDIALVKDVIGNPARIVFDETHLGTVESGSVMGLVRRFRLQGVVVASIVCALLFIWQSSSPFPPERTATPGGDTQLAAASASEGLLNLLTYHIPAHRIVMACVEEWRKDRGRLVSPGDLSRIQSIAGEKAHPAAQWREIRNLLDKKTK